MDCEDDRFMKVDFIDKFKSVFGKKDALILKFAGFTDGETQAAGCWVFTESGRKWLDFGSFGIHLLGHRHPAIIQRATAQLQKMGMSTKILGNYMATMCAEDLLNTLPSKMRRVVFANSGAESVENAIKIAMLLTRRREFIALKHSYHGKTTGALSVSYQSSRHPEYNFSKIQTHFVDPGDAEAVEAHLRSEKIAAVIVEPVLGEGGIISLSDTFLKNIRSLCDAYGTLFIMDEIQTGLGRCGKLWRSAASDCAPDVVLVGKILGGGVVPISAVVLSEIIDDQKCNDPILNASSFSGGAFACSIAQEVINIVSKKEFLDDVKFKGDYCRSFLHRELSGYEDVVDIRGEGLMLGIEFVSSDTTSQVLVDAAKRGILLSFCLNRPKVMRFYPPAVTSLSDLDYGLEQVCHTILGLKKVHRG
jgi:acetylornithine/succinyldiaminopimelate/putrescine aminotransferase